MAGSARLMLVAGARPNFMKVAPILDAVRALTPSIEPTLVHTGQHYDAALSRVFFEDLGLPRPDRDLGVGSGSHGAQTAEVLRRFDALLTAERPDAVLVVGDVNSTLACALAASKHTCAVIHVEAGLRSFDRGMPEEVNRVVTDAIADLLFASEPSGVDNLKREGIPQERVHLVGNVMIDTLLAQREKARASDIHARLGVDPGRYAVLTMHRPRNVDDPATLRRILRGLGGVGRDLPIVFPIHPRTMAKVSAHRLEHALAATPGLYPVTPMGYLDFLELEAEARLVLTDSGGIQEETTALGVPCLTLRDTTERPITLTEGTNTLVGTDPDRIVSEARRVLSQSRQDGHRRPELWDGSAAERIAKIIEAELAPAGTSAARC